MWKDVKYLIAYIAPLSAFFAIAFQGIWSFSAIYVAFVLIPLLELIGPRPTDNLSPGDEKKKASAFFFDLLLYINVPLMYVLLFWYFNTVAAGGLQTYEVVGLTLSVGLVAATIGINVAHELGHRDTWYEQLMSKTLLLTALYMHFFIEHNRGHHRNVGTDDDPASAHLGQTVYGFWWQSVTGGYRHAWRLERERLAREGRPSWSLHNEMIRFQLVQLAYLAGVGLVFGWAMTGFAVFVALFGILLLECVNYIEHYGLRRQRLDSGRFEPVSPRHSWNSDHEVGRIFLYELTRHSDHHYKATRKYQVLRHFDNSPQLPFGYPTSIIISLMPPLWFSVMNRRVREATTSSLPA